MRFVGWGVLVAATMFVVLGSSGTAERATPGDPAVYERIARETDCQALREGLGRNERDAARRYDDRHESALYEIVESYARDYRKRIDELGC